MGELCVAKGVFCFGVGGFLRKGSHLRPIDEKRVHLSNQCPLYHLREEMTDHLLLFHCTKTRVLWDLLFSLFGVFWVLPMSVKDTLLGWKGSFLDKDTRRIWKAGSLCIFWTVWKARNDIVFRDEVCLYKD